MVQQIFERSSWSTTDVLLGMFLFTVQIYADFSGYSDIARGISKTLGFEIVTNFRNPYFSKNPSEFWQRWHISLSSWLRDYLYIPLGGNKVGAFLMYRNLMITMILGGLWHGARWNFILWGVFHGLLLCVYRFFKLQDFTEKKAPFLSTLILFFLIMYGWLLFKAESFQQIYAMTVSLCSFQFRVFQGELPSNVTLLALFLGACIDWTEWKVRNVRFYEKLPLGWIAFLVSVFIWFILLSIGNPPSEFIYFQF